MTQNMAIPKGSTMPGQAARCVFIMSACSDIKIKNEAPDKSLACERINHEAIRSLRMIALTPDWLLKSLIGRFKCF